MPARFQWIQERTARSDAASGTRLGHALEREVLNLRGLREVVFQGLKILGRRGRSIALGDVATSRRLVQT